MPVATIARLHVSPDEARILPNDPGHPSARVLAHGSMEVRWYRPRPGERHEPHDRDEVYVVVSGTAHFYRGSETGPFDEGEPEIAGHDIVPVAAGDVMFVPAGTYHEFDDVSPDFAVWAVFYGPEGGERE